MYNKFGISSIQSLSRAWLFETPWTAAHQASLSINNFWSLLKLTSTESVMPSNHLILCCPLLLPSIFPSIRVFSNESVLHIRWTKYWSFTFSISPSNEYSGMISFRMDWLDIRAVQGTLKRLLHPCDFPGKSYWSGVPLPSPIKKQGHYFIDKVPYSQSYDSSSSHVWRVVP